MSALSDMTLAECVIYLYTFMVKTCAIGIPTDQVETKIGMGSPHTPDHHGLTIVCLSRFAFLSKAASIAMLFGAILLNFINYSRP